MGISLNTNISAADAAVSLNNHYSRLATSTQRLSSGLRINSAADDAAGLAIRELMRADIAALRQGTRNVNDAISLIQTFDGALGVIDEKLIRMKELAEQAATGTYDSTQRLMIDSEFQAMGSEIDRIARATDFNGIKMLKGVAQGGEETQTFSFSYGGGLTPAIATADVEAALTNKADLASGTYSITLVNDLFQAIPGQANRYLQVTGGTAGTTYAVQYSPRENVPLVGDRTMFVIDGNAYTLTLGATSVTHNGVTFSIVNGSGAAQTAQAFGPANFTSTDAANSWRVANASNVPNSTITQTANSITVEADLGNGNIFRQTFNGNPATARNLSMTMRVGVDKEEAEEPSVKIHFGPGNDSAEDYYYINKHDCTLKGLGLDGVRIATQDAAQEALVSIDEAMIAKDKVRAYLGAMQNRLENTMTNLTIQAENLQAAESRLSDADIAREMTAFVRNQILTNSAVAMLSQANSMPQMLLRLLN